MYVEKTREWLGFPQFRTYQSNREMKNKHLSILSGIKLVKKLKSLNSELERTPYIPNIPPQEISSVEEVLNLVDEIASAGLEQGETSNHMVKVSNVEKRFKSLQNKRKRDSVYGSSKLISQKYQRDA